MKYWILTSEYPPFYGGGISTYCEITARTMAQKGIKVTVFVPDPSVKDIVCINEKENLAVVTFNPDYSRQAGTLGYVATLSYSFAEIVKFFLSTEGTPDYIEAQEYLGIAYYLQQFKLTGLIPLQDVPIIITLHSPAFVYLEYNRVPTYRFPEFWICEMEKSSIIGADILISPTHFIVKEIQKYLDLSSKKIQVIPNPFLNDNINVSQDFTRNKIVYYGKLSAQKGTFRLFEYFDELWKQGFQHSLTIIGGTDIVFHPEGMTMQQIAEKRYGHYIKKGLLILNGKITANEITDKLKDAHLVILPSIVDNLPYVVMECMSRKKVVLASVQGGQREIITDGENGFLFDHEQPGVFSSKLLAILEMTDQELARITDNASESLKRYNPDEVVSMKINFLNETKINLSAEPASLFPFVYQEKFPKKNFLNNKLLSIIIPYYNMGKYIDECISSILAADYPEKEIIVINDGSTDELSIQKLKEWKEQGTVKIIHQRNRGLAETRNAGAMAASGRYLAFLDADDKVSDSYFSKAISILEKYENVFFVGGWTKYFENSSSVWPTHNPQPPYLLVHNPVNSSSLVYERNSFLKNGQNDKRVDYGLEDYESVISMVEAGCNGVVIPEVHFFYRVRKGSMIRKITKEKLLYSYKYIGDKHAEYYLKFATPVAHLLNANGPGFIIDNPTIESGTLHKFKIYRYGRSYIKQLAGRYPFVKRGVINFLQLINKVK